MVFITVNRFVKFLLCLYAVIFIWWIKLQLIPSSQTESYLFNWSYGLIGITASLYAINVALSKWGGWNSLIGKGLFGLGFGLFAQWFGLQIWTYYNLIANVEVPYPSLADVGYFGLAPAYAFAALMFALAAGAKLSLRTRNGKAIAIGIPFTLLAGAYFLFVHDIGFDLTQPVKLFFDLAYPLGEVLPVAIALFTLTLSKNILGGTMRKRVLFLVVAFIFQFLTEYYFLYAVGVESYVNGGVNDILYASSYALMGLAIANFSYYD